VALGPDGDFRIDDTLNPAVPSACASPVLLIRNTVAPVRGPGSPTSATTTTDRLSNRGQIEI